MSALGNIAIRVETADRLARNALPVLHEVRHALRRLVDCGKGPVGWSSPDWRRFFR
jgi:hypothetical protein